jgi:hypothetical protein
MHAAGRWNRSCTGRSYAAPGRRPTGHAAAHRTHREAEMTSPVESEFIRAAIARRLVWLTEPTGRYRVVEPYMVYRSPKGRRLFHFFQVGGYSAGGVIRGWRNPEVAAFDSAQILDETFTPRPDYNPLNPWMFPEVVYAVPTAEGRERSAMMNDE